MSLPSMQTYDRIAPVDTSIEQEGHPDAPGAAAMRVRQPVSPLRNHMSMREAVPGFRSKLDAEPSATHVAVSPPGMQPLCDARAGQFAGIPAANIAQIPENELGIAANEHPALAREPFMAIDSGGDDTSAKWVLAGGHRAEAGFQDSSLGWVSVRAQAGAEGIHAAVVPSSDVAAQVLGSHLAGLNAHLASQYEHLNPVTLLSSQRGLGKPGIRTGDGPGKSSRHGHGRQQQQMREDPAPNSNRGRREFRAWLCRTAAVQCADADADHSSESYRRTHIVHRVTQKSREFRIAEFKHDEMEEEEMATQITGY